MFRLQEKRRRGRQQLWTQLMGGCWNVRRLGASASHNSDSYDPMFKIQCILTLMAVRGWDFCLLSDCMFPSNGCREYQCRNRTWTLVHRGKVSILLSDSLAAEWRRGGAAVVMRGRQDRKTTRCMSIVVPRQGRRRGLALVAVYAPVSGRQNVRARERFREEVRYVEAKCRGSDNMVVLGGDWNAEPGRPVEEGEQDRIGAHGGPRRTVSGSELSEFC